MHTYKVVEINLNTVSYKALINQIPTSELNDKLTFFTREGGLIPHDLYNDFLIANCISNIGDLLQYLQHTGADFDELADIRKEMVSKCIEINPLLSPENIIINNNQVMKIKSKIKQRGSVPLIENKYWDKPLYEDKESDKPTTIDEIVFRVIQKFWRRLGTYINIKQFEVGSEVIIIGDKQFDRKTSFEHYIVTVCVVEIEDIFEHLEKMLQPQQMLASTLLHELYELCIKVNPFLDFDAYKNNVIEEDGGCKVRNPLKLLEEGESKKSSKFSEALKDEKKISFKNLNKNVLLNLAKNIKKEVIGQNKAVDALVSAIRRASVGLKNPIQPIGAFIFTGASGCGKTYTAKSLIKNLTNSGNNLITIDCSEFSADHEYAKLIGAPNGYVSHEQGGRLTNAIKKNPFSVILFDEIEKASNKVYQLLLQIMDEGRLTDGKGDKVSFKDSIIIMTSNLGVTEIGNIKSTIGFGDVTKVTEDKKNTVVKKALKKQFSPEFLNRVSGVINFEFLSKKSCMKIIKLELEKLKLYFKLNKTAYSRIKLIFDKSVYDYIYVNGIDEELGVRPLKRCIESKITSPLADKILQEDMDINNTLIITSVKNEQVVFKINKLANQDNNSIINSIEGGNTD